MATAIAFGSTNIPGVVLGRGADSRGVNVGPRDVQQRTTKFFGLRGESRINGYPGGRFITVPVLIYDSGATFDTAAKLTEYLAQIIGTDLPGTTGSLTITSDADWPVFDDCVFEGAQIVQEVLPDVAGTLAAGTYWCIVEFAFRQLSAVATP